MWRVVEGSDLAVLHLYQIQVTPLVMTSPFHPFPTLYLSLPCSAQGVFIWCPMSVTTCRYYFFIHVQKPSHIIYCHSKNT